MAESKMSEELKNKNRVIEQAKKLGIADETKIRNMQIRDEYNTLRKDKKYEEVIEILASKHFRSESLIKKIVGKI